MIVAVIAIAICVLGTIAACALCSAARRTGPYLAPPGILSQKPRERDRSHLA